MLLMLYRLLIAFSLLIIGLVLFPAFWIVAELFFRSKIHKSVI
jgi:hypothetical protein